MESCWWLDATLLNGSPGKGFGPQESGHPLWTYQAAGADSPQGLHNKCLSPENLDTPTACPRPSPGEGPGRHIQAQGCRGGHHSKLTLYPGLRPQKPYPAPCIRPQEAQPSLICFSPCLVIWFLFSKITMTVETKPAPMAPGDTPGIVRAPEMLVPLHSSQCGL